MMNENENTFKKTIDEAFNKINQFQGGNILFYKKFHRSRAVVSTWKAGKVIPQHDDILKFIEVSNEVIRECIAEKEARNKKQSELMSEFTSLVSA